MKFNSPLFWPVCQHISSITSIINLTYMVNDEKKTPGSTNESIQDSQTLKDSGSQRNFHYPQKNNDRRKRGPEPPRGKDSLPSLQENGAVSTERETGTDDEADSEPEHSSLRQRHMRGGRPEKRIIEESAYDPYCE
jgi:hypothetical protein